MSEITEFRYFCHIFFFFLSFLFFNAFNKKKIMFLHEGSFSNICAVGLGQNSKYHAASLGANCERRKKT